MKVLKTSRSFKKEFKKQLKLAIIAAIGFSIAYAWKESILNIMSSAAQNIGTNIGIGNSPLYAPILTTVIGVIFIFLLSKIFKDK